VLSFPGLQGHEYKQKVFFRQHYRIILAASLEKINSHILGGVVTIHLIISNIKPWYEKRIAMMFSFCWLAT